MAKTEEKLIVDGKRKDGREPGQMRDAKMELDIVSRADGSARVAFGDTVAVVSAYGPRRLFPRFMQEQETGILRCRYNMSPFSTTERIRPGSSRRGTEISKVTKHAFEPVLFLEEFPKATMDVFEEVLQADGSTRVTAINAASLALAEAGAKMRDLVAACSVGKVDGTLVLDLNGLEDNNSDADVAVAMMPGKGEVTLLQMDGILTKEELTTLLGMAEEACKKIYEMQRKTLIEKYKTHDVEVEEGAEER